ncbi:MAG: ABC transporter ATP-binding protein [Candidatus Sumerlaeaceae bacterium]|nr:ABC transporter ATP-binding protein [Candidatus Sumerlaeaceae bacterium]
MRTEVGTERRAGATMDASKQEPVLEAREVSFSYDRRCVVVKNVTLSFLAGEFWGIIGPNGAGKSTLLRVLAGGLLPQSGQVLLEGVNINKLAKYQIAQKIAFVPQKTSVAFDFTALELVLMGRQPYAGLSLFEDAHDLEVAHRALELTGIKHISSKLFHELSGGEQQLVVLARAVAQEAPILILDEPVTFLDLHHQWDVLTLLCKLVREGRCVIATFHDLNAAARWCDRLALMVNAEIWAYGTTNEVLKAELLCEAYGLPLAVEVAPSGFTRVELP